MAVPLVFLLMLSLALLLREAVQRRQLRLPEQVFQAWIAVLALAWFIQLSREAFVRWFFS